MKRCGRAKHELHEQHGPDKRGECNQDHAQQDRKIDACGNVGRIVVIGDGSATVLNDPARKTPKRRVKQTERHAKPESDPSTQIANSSNHAPTEHRQQNERQHAGCNSLVRFSQTSNSWMEQFHTAVTDIGEWH